MGGSLDRFWEKRRHLDKGRGVPMGKEHSGVGRAGEAPEANANEPGRQELGRQTNRHRTYVRFGREATKRNR